MRKLAMLAGFAGVLFTAGAAQALPLTFEAIYDVSTYDSSHDSGNGLTVYHEEIESNPFTFDLDFVGDSYGTDLFKLWTPESSVGDDDLTPQPITVAFTFNQPTGFNGDVDGETSGSGLPFLFGGYILDSGEVVWNDPVDLAFAGDGILRIELEDGNFNSGLIDLHGGMHHGFKVGATFTLLQDPGEITEVAEPLTASLLGVGLIGLGALRRRTRMAA